MLSGAEDWGASCYLSKAEGITKSVSILAVCAKLSKIPPPMSKEPSSKICEALGAINNAEVEDLSTLFEIRAATRRAIAKFAPQGAEAVETQLPKNAKNFLQMLYQTDSLREAIVAALNADPAQKAFDSSTWGRFNCYTLDEFEDCFVTEIFQYLLQLGLMPNIGTEVFDDRVVYTVR